MKGPTGPSDVVLAVHGPSPDLQRCLSAVERHTRFDRHRLLVVADGPLPEGPERLVAGMAERLPRAVVRLAHPERRGYPAAANTGIRASGRDVVLLNSDTEVTEGWLEKLHQAAYSASDVATATPFSNNATICSLPRFLEENLVPAGHTVDSFGALVERVSPRLYPVLPTGVGFCLYVKREVLETVGLLDEGAFGLGYGEEDDLCQRAARRGYRHVLDDATFVYHAGRGSFGAEGRGRARRAERVLARRHPAFLPAVARFIREDPLRPLRERVLAALTPPRRLAGKRPARRVAHLVHGWPPFASGGTEVYARTLALAQAGRHDVAVYARLEEPRRALGDALELVDGGVRVRLVVNNFSQRDPLSRNALHDRRLARDFERFLEGLRPDVLHVHHLAGTAATLPGVARRLGIPIVFQLQDWWAPCARVNLLDHEGRRCTGPSPLKCARCMPLTSIPPAGGWSAVLHAVRAALQRRALDAAGACLCGSRFLAESYRRLGWLPGGAAVRVLPYGADVPAGERAAHPPARRPVRFGFVGPLMPHKGALVAVEAFRGLPATAARLVVWGDPSAAGPYGEELRRAASGGPVEFRGRFEEGRRDEAFDSMDVLLVPSLGLESYGIAVDEAMARGVPVVASRDGALVERYDESCGGFFPPGDVAALRGWVALLSSEPARIDAWRRALPRVRPLSENARDVDELYDRLLGPGGRP